MLLLKCFFIDPTGDHVHGGLMQHGEFLFWILILGQGYLHWEVALEKVILQVIFIMGNVSFWVSLIKLHWIVLLLKDLDNTIYNRRLLLNLFFNMFFLLLMIMPSVFLYEFFGIRVLFLNVNFCDLLDKSSETLLRFTIRIDYELQVTIIKELRIAMVEHHFEVCRKTRMLRTKVVTALH